MENKGESYKGKRRRTKRIEALNACLNKASDRYHEDWNSHCSKKGGSLNALYLQVPFLFLTSVFATAKKNATERMI